MNRSVMQTTWDGMFGTVVASRDAAPSLAQRIRSWVHARRSDRRLLQLARRGDVLAYGALVERFRNRVYTMALGSLGDPEHAGDVVCEVFVTAYRRLDRSTSCSPGAWFQLLAAAVLMRRLGGGRYGIDVRAAS